MNGLAAAQRAIDRYLPDDDRTDAEIEGDARLDVDAKRQAASPVLQAHLKAATERYSQHAAKIKTTQRKSSVRS